MFVERYKKIQPGIIIQHWERREKGITAKVRANVRERFYEGRERERARERHGERDVRERV